MKKSHLLSALFLSAALLFSACPQTTDSVAQGTNNTGNNTGGGGNTVGGGEPEWPTEADIVYGGCVDQQCGERTRFLYNAVEGSCVNECMRLGCDITLHSSKLTTVFDDALVKSFKLRGGKFHEKSELKIMPTDPGVFPYKFLGDLSDPFLPCFSDDDNAAAFTAASMAIDEMHRY